MARYVPDVGEIVWLQFNPQTGHEQAGHRPALCITPKSYNAKSGLMVCCPMTTAAKGYPFEVPNAGDPPAVVLADQVKNLDWQARGARYKDRISADELADVRAKVQALLFSP